MRKGVSLLEAILVIGICAMIVALISPLFYSSARTWENDKELASMLAEAKVAMDKITREIKEAPSITKIDTTSGDYIAFGVADILLDDGNAGHSKTGTWTRYDSSTSAVSSVGFAGDYEMASATAGSTASYKFRIVAEGKYDIYVRYVATPANSQVARYVITGLSSSIEWWNTSYSRRRKLKITAGSSQVQEGYTVFYTFNHQQLVSLGHSRADGNDIRIVYWNGNTFKELDRYCTTSWNSTTTTIIFQVQKTIQANSFDSNYYMYYSNPSAGAGPSDRRRIYAFFDDFEDAMIPSWYVPVGGGCWSESGGILQQTCDVPPVAGDPQKLVLKDKTYPEGIEVFARVRVDTRSDGDQARAGIAVRSHPTTSRGYNWLFHDSSGSGSWRFQHLSDQYCWNSATSTSFNVGEWWYMKMRVIGTGASTTIRSKAWKEGESEPGDSNCNGAGCGGTCAANECVVQNWSNPCGSSPGNSYNSGYPALTAVTYLSGGSGQMRSSYDDFSVRYYVNPEPTVSEDLDTPTWTEYIDQTQNGGKWNKLNTAYTYEFAEGFDGQVQLFSTTSGTVVADGVRLVYKDSSSKVFYYDSTNNRLHFRSSSSSNSSSNMLADRIYRVGGITPIFSYFDADGITPATSEEKVYLVRIAFEIRDPRGRLHPYVLRSEVSLENLHTRQRLVINEINYSPKYTILASDDFDGSYSNFQLESYFNETFTHNLTGWGSDPHFTTDAGTWEVGVEGYMRQTQTGNSWYRARYTSPGGTFREMIVNCKVRFSPSAGGNSYAGVTFYTSAADTYYAVWLFRQNVNQQYIQIAEAVSGNPSSQASTSFEFAPGIWYYLKVLVQGYVVSAGSGRVNIKVYISNDGVNFSKKLDWIDTTPRVPGTVGLIAYATEAHFDDLIVTSHPWRRVAYLTDFDTPINNWSTSTTNDLGFQIGITSKSIPAGSGNVLITRLSGDYSQNTATTARTPNIDLSGQPGWTYASFFAWQDMAPGNDTNDGGHFRVYDASVGGNGITITDATASDVGNNIYVTAGQNYTTDSYDGAITDPLSGLEGMRITHTPLWWNIRAKCFVDATYANQPDFQFMFRWWGDNDTSSGPGWAINNFEVATGGPWEIGTPTVGPSSDNTPDYSPVYTKTDCAGTRVNANYPNYANCALESAPISIPSNAVNIVLEWYQWLSMDGGNTDGGWVEVCDSGGCKQIEDISPYYTTRITPGFSNENQGKWAYTISSSSWTRVRATLGTSYNGRQIRIRFRFSSSSSGNSAGWYIDDFEVIDFHDKDYFQFIELYNASDTSIDLSGYRIYTNTHIGSGDSYDLIVADGEGTVISPGQYAIITTQITQLYSSGSPYLTYINQLGGGELRLKIDDNYFGKDGLTTEYGWIKLTDATGELVDYVTYNLLFYDDFESYTGSNAQGWRLRWSTNSFGNSTNWRVDVPTIGDYTIGVGGRCFLLNNGTVNERYNNQDECAIYLPALDFTATTTDNPPRIEFYHYINISSPNDDGGILQVSILGGSESDFGQDPNLDDGDATYVIGDRLTPTYSGVVDATSNVLGNGSIDYNAYTYNVTSWTKVSGNLQDFAGKVATIRFFFATGTAGSNLGSWFIDNVAVYFYWGGYSNGYTLERKSWKGDGTSYKNWQESAILYGTPGGKNTAASI